MQARQKSFYPIKYSLLFFEPLFLDISGTAKLFVCQQLLLCVPALGQPGAGPHSQAQPGAQGKGALLPHCLPLPSTEEPAPCLSGACQGFGSTWEWRNLLKQKPSPGITPAPASELLLTCLGGLQATPPPASASACSADLLLKSQTHTTDYLLLVCCAVFSQTSPFAKGPCAPHSAMQKAP